MSSVPVPTRRQVLALYKQFIKNSNQFNNYNFRQYFLRKSRSTFKESADLKDTVQVTNMFNEAKKELGILKRQAVISQMYTFDKTVVEPTLKLNHTQ
ncbi:hypothetical protein KAFR_0L00750 [Kazachstania africana CBS 2517]|uniref:Complex 1 LYR protein domain-containing protein n=1 Tax=Kazachstania africana (strain ATCC 22294 / BCRC 22015 / CBS 2517 / CECT 1963 / NBRC 1671 / NRRL Y-8276) TaxID=1071382 RepID=H2B232_KAZAF|nr:hypothetical protein KAFR_0L00750 [Kazachstania africana CBS 2517]CCF60682.1 hypothetical protein KAFR_0L00750 [Kazachstania africana CBS 2517]